MKTKPRRDPKFLRRAAKSAIDWQGYRIGEYRSMPEKKEIKETLHDIRDRLEQLRSRLELLSSAIWQDIDHEDPDRLEAGVRFKQRYNVQRKALDGCVDQMLALLQEYPQWGPEGGTRLEAETAAEAVVAPTASERAPRPAPIQTDAAPMIGNLDQKAPFGFILGGQTFTSASAWPLFYEALLQELYARAAERLSHLADAPGAFTYRGRPLFARVPDRLDDPLPIAEALFAEADLEPDMLLQVIRGLITELGYPLESFKILLREKKRGTVETLSIAA
jgi:hypothetical protein